MNMKHLKAVNKYFWKYRWRFLLGFIFIILSNYFKIIGPQITRFVIDAVESSLPGFKPKNASSNYDALVSQMFHSAASFTFNQKIILCGVVLLITALVSGFFLFLTRQTIIVMSRLIEYDQKNEVYSHYQLLDSAFYKRNSTGDLMNRITEDVSRVRMYTGPALMYFINLAATIGFCIFYMVKENPRLTLYVLAPLPLLAAIIYFINNIIHRKSERIQALLSDLTTAAQESYSGIRVIKSFVQEKAMLGFFDKKSEEYRANAIGLAKLEAVYFPSMSLIIGLSTLLTIMIGGFYSLTPGSGVTTGTIAEFVMYVNMLTFPVSAIGWTASMVQRASASQKRLNEFLQTEPAIGNAPNAVDPVLTGHIQFNNVNFVYPDTGIHAIKDFSLDIKKGEKVAIIGRTGSGKTTLAQLLLRMYDPSGGNILIDGINLKEIQLRRLREQISYVPQDVFLFSDTVTGNIRFGAVNTSFEDVVKATQFASVEKEINQFSGKFDTMIGERGVTLSGGQKQRISIARALIKNPQMVVFDDCLSAVDASTEKEIISNLYAFLHHKTAIIITHRIFSLFDFDKIVVLENGRIVEMGRHQDLIARNGYYAYLYEQQQLQEHSEKES